MKTVLVTGGSRGIGKAVCDKFLSMPGYEVLAPVREELNLSSESSVKDFIDNSSVDYDIIINNAGINDINLIEDVTDEEIDAMLQINLVAPMKLLRGFTGAMKRKNYGRIVNIGSIWGIVSKEGRLVYTATKHAIHGVTAALAVELAQYNILVNTVCPGYTLTELTYKNNSSEEIAEISDTIPIGRMAQPAEISELIYFLCSERNTYITGQQIVVDGGFTSK